MKAILNKFAIEINKIITEIDAIEETIQVQFNRHNELSDKLVGLFDELQEVAQKKLDLPVCEATVALSTEAEEAARRKRFRNLGDGIALSTPPAPPTAVETKVERNDIDKYGNWIPGYLNVGISYNYATNRYLFDRSGERFNFNLPKGYRLLSPGEEYGAEDEFINNSNESWLKCESRCGKVGNTTYPIRRKIDG